MSAAAPTSSSDAPMAASQALRKLKARMIPKGKSRPNNLPTELTGTHIVTDENERQWLLISGQMDAWEAYLQDCARYSYEQHVRSIDPAARGDTTSPGNAPFPQSMFSANPDNIDCYGNQDDVGDSDMHDTPDRTAPELENPVNLAEQCGFKVKDWRSYRLKEQRTRQHWDQEMDHLITGYLIYRAKKVNNSISELSEENLRDALPYLGSFQSRPCTVIDSHGYEKKEMDTSQYHSNAFALSQGWLGTVPLAPSTFVSLAMLEECYYLQLEGHVSLTGYVASICSRNFVPYSDNVYRRFLEAYRAFGMIRTAMETGIRKVIQQDTVKEGFCPACFYKVSDEEDLVYDVLATIDGNNSLKRQTQAGGSQTHKHHYQASFYRDEDYVDQFAAELDSQVQGDLLELTNDAVKEGGGTCANWKSSKESSSAGKDAGLVHETGIFSCCCRHGFLLLFVDMVRSGERRKYPFAVIHALLTAFPGLKFLMGYDIGCVFSKSLQRLRSEWFRNQSDERVTSICGAFHGYAHSRACQLTFHPRIVTGAGLEDFEQNEHLYSSSNRLASTTRHMSSQNRHIRIADHFQQWNYHKFCNLGSLVKSKYLQAQKVLTQARDDLQSASAAGYTKERLRIYIQEEKQYIDSIKEPITTTQEQWEERYVTAIRDALELQLAWDRFYVEPALFHPEYSEVRRRNLLSKLLRTALESVTDCEHHLQIQLSWTPESPHFKAVEIRIATRKYRQARKELEGLVASRLLEMEKLFTPGTGYDQRTLICQNLARRSKSIENARKKLNQEAAKLNPPKRPIAAADIFTPKNLADFTMLDDQIQTAEWTKPEVRQWITAMHLEARATEELQRLHIEIPRILTFLRDEAECLLEWTVFYLHPQTTPSATERLKAVAYIDRARELHVARYKILADLGKLKQAVGVKQDCFAVKIPAMLRSRPLFPADFDKQQVLGDWSKISVFTFILDDCEPTLGRILPEILEEQGLNDDDTDSEADNNALEVIEAAIEAL